MAYDTFKVLIVDDDPMALKLYGQTLSKHHYEVVTAGSGPEALEIVLREEPDVVLLDIMMPKVDGYQVCSQLRSSPRTTDIPILMLTSLTGVDARRKAFEIGADDFVTKGEPLDHLDGRIKMLIKQRILAHTRSWLADLHGSVSLDHALRARLSAGYPLAVCFVDLRDLGRYNESAGYDAGDRILWTLARILRDQVQNRGTGDYVGYRGQDDFLILSTPESVEDLARNTLEAYAAAADQVRLGYAGGAEVPGLSIGVVIVNAGQVMHPGQVNGAGQDLLAALRAEPGDGLRVVRLGPVGVESVSSSELPAARASEPAPTRSWLGVDRLINRQGV